MCPRWCSTRISADTDSSGPPKIKALLQSRWIETIKPQATTFEG
jgi:hypothetical protein